jgi:nicotinamidase-related amidase
MKTALLVIDVQNDIVAGMGTPERQPAIDRALDEIVVRLRGLQEKARQAGIPVIMCSITAVRVTSWKKA